MNRIFSKVRVVTVATLGALLMSHAADAEANWCPPGHSRGHGHYGHDRHYRSVVRLAPIVISLGGASDYAPGTRYYRRDWRRGCDLPRRRSIVPRIRRREIVDVYEAEPEIYLVNVPNRNGSFTPVTLQVQRNGSYVGPRGEVYLSKPEMEQLKQMYGQ